MTELYSDEQVGTAQSSSASSISFLDHVKQCVESEAESHRQRVCAESRNELPTRPGPETIQAQAAASGPTLNGIHLPKERRRSEVNEPPHPGDTNSRKKTTVSEKKVEANRRNAQLSTGPRTQQGKSWSRRNALKHGILTNALLITGGRGWEDEDGFKELLAGLREDLSPEGMLEDLLVQKIAICCWRQRRALECEARLFQRQRLIPLDQAALTIEKLEDACRDVDHVEGLGHKTFQQFIRLPLGPALDQVLRYETTISRQLAFALNQLERLQRARKGEHVPAPVSVQVSGDQISGDQ